MSDAAAQSPVKETKKPAAKKKTGTKKAPEHPKYNEMIEKAIESLKERGGSSRQAILKYIQSNFKVGDGAATHLKLALKRGVAGNLLKQVKGTGASGSFKLADKPKKVAPKATKGKKAVVKKAAVKKTPSKKAAVKKATPKKAAKKPVAKKPAAKKTAKKAPAKKPVAKKAAKKTPKKKAGKKAAKK